MVTSAFGHHNKIRPYITVGQVEPLNECVFNIYLK